jgi:hypothetical protein
MKPFALALIALSLFSTGAYATTCELTCEVQTSDSQGVVATQAAFHPVPTTIDTLNVARSCKTDLLMLGSDQVQFQAMDHFGTITLKIRLNGVEATTKSIRHRGFYALQAGKYQLNCTIFEINLF